MTGLIVKEIAAGVDISKSKLTLCIKNHGGVVATGDFINDIAGGKPLLELLEKHGCGDVAMESTGPYTASPSYPQLGN